jgi:hypothetical protein
MQENNINKLIYLYLSIISFISSFITIYTGVGKNNALYITLGVILILVAIFFISKYYRSTQYSSKKLDNISFSHPLKEDIKKIVELDKKVFKEEDVIDADIFMRWYRKNPKTFTCLYYKDKLIAYYSILPLRKEALEALCNGYLKECNIKGSDILDQNDMFNISHFYFFSFVISKRYPMVFFALLSHAIDTVNTLFNDGKLRKIFATAATREGEKLLRRLQFQKIQDSDDRADKHDLYSKDIESRILLESYFKKFAL